jgi:hypothetical protein
MISIRTAILSLLPDAVFAITNNQYNTIEWNDSRTKPTEEQIQAEIIRLENETTANAYKAKRAKEYPAIGDQLDALFHAGVFPPEMAALIQAVKDKYPKEQS